MIIETGTRLVSVVNIRFAVVEGLIDFVSILSRVNSRFTIFERLINVFASLLLFRGGQCRIILNVLLDLGSFIDQ